MGLPLLAFCLTKKAGGCHCLRLFKKGLGVAIACFLFLKRRQGLPLLIFVKEGRGCHCLLF
jgi:hypothetical protein